MHWIRKKKYYYSNCNISIKKSYTTGYTLRKSQKKNKEGIYTFRNKACLKSFIKLKNKFIDNYAMKYQQKNKKNSWNSRFWVKQYTIFFGEQKGILRNFVMVKNKTKTNRNIIYPTNLNEKNVLFLITIKSLQVIRLI